MDVPACSLCRKIPRASSYASASEVATELSHLGPFDASGWRPCPECPTRYFVRYESTYDDGSFEERVEVVRDTSLRGQVQLLSHPESCVRQDAGYQLARKGRAELAWHHEDPLVRRSALEALEEPLDVRFLLHDVDQPTRRKAAQLTLGWLLQRSDSPGLLEVLEGAPPDVRAQAIARLREGEGLEAAVLAETLEKGSGAELLAGWEWLAGRGYQRERQLQRLREAVQQGDLEVRKAAISALERLHPHWGDSAEAILESLKEVLDSDPATRLWVLKCLRRLDADTDLRPFLSRLGELLASENSSHFQEAGRLLHHRLQLGEVEADLVTRLMPGLTFENASQKRLIVDCYKALMAAGVPLGPAEEMLLRVVASEGRPDVLQDLLVPAMTTYLLRRQAWPELERLLRGGSEVAGQVARVLATQPYVYAPLLPLLEELLDHPSHWVAENCLKALVR